MIRTRFGLCATLLAGLLVAAPALADVTVWLDAQDTVIPAVGQPVNVELWASVTDPIMAWGLDLTIQDVAVTSLTGHSIGTAWDATTTLDGDGLAGLRFPTGITGDVLLATLTFEGLTAGTTPLLLSSGPEEDEGFLLQAGTLDTNVTFVPASITVVPEPTMLALFGLGAAMLLRRR